MAASIQESGNSSSLTLVARLKTGDEAAWRRFSVIYGPLVLGWAQRGGLAEPDAADIVQETFQAVAKNLGDFRRDRAGDTFRGWLWTITRSKLNDHYRRRAREPAAVGGSEALQRIQELPDRLPEDQSGQKEFAAVARRALSIIQTDFQLSTWRAFWGTAIDGRRAADVAADLGMSVPAVYMARTRVLARLRDELDDQPESP